MPALPTRLASHFTLVNAAGHRGFDGAGCSDGGSVDYRRGGSGRSATDMGSGVPALGGSAQGRGVVTGLGQGGVSSQSGRSQEWGGSVGSGGGRRDPSSRPRSAAAEGANLQGEAQHHHNFSRPTSGASGSSHHTQRPQLDPPRSAMHHDIPEQGNQPSQGEGVTHPVLPRHGAGLQQQQQQQERQKQNAGSISALGSSGGGHASDDLEAMLARYRS